MSDRTKPVSRKDDIVVQELNGEVLVYDLRTDKALCLNETSSIIWAACDGTRNVSQIGAYASEKLNAQVNDDLVWLALDEFRKEHLLTTAPDTDHYFEGVSRRDVIKKIGIASAIAIPVVMGLIAPPAANAASICGAACNPGNNPCTNAACPTCSNQGAGNVCHA